MSLALILDAYFLESDEDAGGEGDDATREEEEKVNCKIEDPDGDELVPLETPVPPLQDEENDHTNVSSEPTQMCGDSIANTLPEPDTPSFQDNGIESKIVDKNGLPNSCNDSEKASYSRNEDFMESEEMFDRMPVPESVAGSEVNNESSHLSSYVQKEEPLKCPYCLGIYLGADELIQHLATHPKAQKQEKKVITVMQTNSIDQPREASHKHSNKFKRSERKSTFIRRRDLHKTITSHKKTRRPIKCTKCSYASGNSVHLRRHMKIHDETGRPWKCERCHSFFMSRNQLRHHENLRHGRKSEHKCSVCNKIFIWESELEYHKRFHEETGRPWKCSLCNYFFLTLGYLQGHENRVHGKVITPSQPHQCLVCSTTPKFYSRDKLKSHMEIHKKGADRRWECSKCLSFFKTASQLRVHENLVHGRKPGKTLIPCKICGKLGTASKMAKHLRSHTGDRPFKCLICNQKFSTKCNTVKHLINLHGQSRSTAYSKVLDSSSNCKEGAWRELLHKLRPCKLVLTRCDGLISSYGKSTIKPEADEDYEDPQVSTKSINIEVELMESSRKAENNLQKGEDNVKRAQNVFRCPFCLEEFMESNLLIVHLPIHTVEAAKQNCKTAEELNQKVLPTIHESSGSPLLNPTKPKSSSEIKPFKCDQCNYSSLVIQGLQYHMRQHSEFGRPFKCSICNYSFTTFKSLRIHEGRFHKSSKLLHTPTPMHKCQQCNYSSKAIGHLMQHLEHHKEEGRPFKCVKCNFTFITFKSLRIHEGRFHKGSESLQSASTPTGARCFDKKGSKSLHNAPARRHKCKHCSYSNTMLQKLRIHLQHHKEKGRPFKCIRCSFTFATFQSLRTHEGRFHKGSKSLQNIAASTLHKCRRCKYSTRILREWENHMASHKKTLRKPFKCSLCGSLFHNFKELRIHTRRLHMNEKTQVEKGISSKFISIFTQKLTA